MKKSTTMNLSQFIEHYGVMKLAQELGVTHGGVSHWRTGKAMPNGKQSLAIERLCKGVIARELELRSKKRKR